MKNIVKIATRKSPLALWQARFVKNHLKRLYPDITVKLVKMVTEGDKILDVPLAKIGGKGLFIKELEQGILNGDADIAVHSLKDVPVEMPEGFKLAVICKREIPFDAFVSNIYDDITTLARGATVGTSSLRRKSQLMALRPDLNIIDLRGNINTRLQKLDNGDYDAIILAAAGLIRLEMPERITKHISPSIILPAVGQGAIGIECLNDATEIQQMIAPLNCANTSARVNAERAMNHTLEGGCQVPIGGYAELDNNKLTLTGLVASIDGKNIIKRQAIGEVSEAEAIGNKLGLELLDNGASEILQELNF